MMIRFRRSSKKDPGFKEVGLLRFPHTWLGSVRSKLLSNLSSEQFCILLGKKHDFTGGFCINVLEIINPGSMVYVSNSIGHVSPSKEFIMFAISETLERADIDTIIDVHTHPFCSDSVSFSVTDDDDEISFLQFITEKFDNINYASVVFSQQRYEARYWRMVKGKAVPSPLTIRTATMREGISKSQDYASNSSSLERELAADGFLNRTALALGRDTLISIVKTSSVMIVGVGGLGSAIAENLVHMGFDHLILVDDDIVEKSNLNRIVGAYWEDAMDARAKVEVVCRHLKSIRPSIKVRCEQKKIGDVDVDAEIASLDWIVLATDNHSSRFDAQELAFKHFIPIVSAGVAITVENGEVWDYSGEVIVIRPGDCFCLSCLNRLNPTQIAFERTVSGLANNFAGGEPDVFLGPSKERLSGYVAGANVKDPAVKMLNSVVASIAVEQLVDQYVCRSEHKPILIYERNKHSAIYPDEESLRSRNLHCFTCSIRRSFVDS